MVGLSHCPCFESTFTSRRQARVRDRTSGQSRQSVSDATATLVPSDSRAVYASPGYVLYVRDGRSRILDLPRGHAGLSPTGGAVAPALGQKKAAGLTVLVHRQLDGREQAGGLWDFINDDRAGHVANEPGRIAGCSTTATTPGLRPHGPGSRPRTPRHHSSRSAHGQPATARSPAARLAQAERLFREFEQLTPYPYPKPFTKTFETWAEYERWRRAQTNPWLR